MSVDELSLPCLAGCRHSHCHDDSCSPALGGRSQLPCLQLPFLQCCTPVDALLMELVAARQHT